MLRTVLVLGCGLAIGVTGCVSMTPEDRLEYGRFRREGRPMVEQKSVAAAVILDAAIPGTGHFYLGYYLEGAGLLLTNAVWPFSILFAVPSAIHDARTYNQQHFVDTEVTRQALRAPDGQSTTRRCEHCQKAIPHPATRCHDCGAEVAP